MADLQDYLNQGRARLRQAGEWVRQKLSRLKGQPPLEAAPVAAAPITLPIAAPQADLRLPEPAALAEPPKVAVLGGGISGLASAYELAKKGVQVTLIEGSNRLGGHIQTKRDAIGDGLYFERGAELVDTQHVALQKLMGELGVGLVDSSQSTDGEFFHHGGKVYSQQQMLEGYKPLAAELKKWQNGVRDANGQWTELAAKADAMSMEAMLDHYVRNGTVEPWVTTMIKQAYSGEVGRDPKEVSALAFLDCIGADPERGFELYGDSDEAYRVENGTESIIHALEDKLKELGVTIVTGEQATGIEPLPDGEGMTVHTSRDGATRNSQTYDYVVSALPLQALRQVQGIEALGFDEGQLATIRDTNYCTLTKFAVETKGKPWLDIRAADGSGGNGTIYTDGTFQSAWVSSEGQPNDDPSPDANGMVTFFVGGANGKMPSAELVTKAKEEYAAIIGKPVSEVFTDAAPAIANWSAERMGCYVAPAPGQYARLQSLREQSHPNFSMVGEYIPVPTERGSTIGFMDNAVDSAQRETARALDILVQRQLAKEKETGVDMAALVRAARELTLPPAQQQGALGEHTARLQTAQAPSRPAGKTVAG